MKSIDLISCDVVQDLLPSYIDKISSEATNTLVENHLRKCKVCKKTLEDMNKGTYDKIIKSQTEQIDYLKRYRKQLLKAIILTIEIMIILVGSLTIFLYYAEFSIDVNKVGFSYSRLDNTSSSECVLFDLSNSNGLFISYTTSEVFEEDGNKSVYINFLGKYNFSCPNSVTIRSSVSVKKDNMLKQIYLRDKNGNVRKIWDKSTGFTS